MTCPRRSKCASYCHLTKEQATLYQAVVDEMLEKASTAVGIERSGIVLAALMKLKQVCNHPAHLLKDRSALEGRSGKLTRLEELLAEALAEGDRALVSPSLPSLGTCSDAISRSGWAKRSCFSTVAPQRLPVTRWCSDFSQGTGRRCSCCR